MKRLLPALLTSVLYLIPAFGQEMKIDTSVVLQEDIQILRTVRGDVFFGRTLSLSPEEIVFQPRTITVLTFTRDEVVWLGFARNADWLRGDLRLSEGGKLSYDPAYNWWEENLAYSMTAFPYPQGEAEFRNISILYNSFDFGISDHLSFGGGIVIPYLLMLRTKYSFGISENFHAGIGASNFVGLSEDNEGFFTHLFLNGTIGKPQRFFNITAGRAFTWDFPEDSAYIVSLGGGFVFSEHWKIYSDVGFSPGNREIIPTMLVSWFKKRNRLELGVLGIPDSDLSVFPLIGYAHRF